MAIVSNKVAKAGMSGSRSARDPRTITVTLLVVTNSLGDGPLTIFSSLGLTIGDPYVFRNEHDPNLFLEDMTAEQRDADATTTPSATWIVTLVYGPFDANTVGGGPANNPLLYPPEPVWNFRNYEKVIDQDVNGVPCVNTAGDPFADPPIVIDDPRPVLTIVRNEAAFDPSLAYKFRNAVNSDTFCGADPQKVKVLNISGNRQWNQDIGYFWVVTYEFEFSPLGFHARPLSQGYRELPSAGGSLQHALDRGVPVTVPVLLDSKGARLAQGGTPVYLDFQVYPEFSFADSFGFPEFVLTGQGGKNQTG